MRGVNHSRDDVSVKDNQLPCFSMFSTTLFSLICTYSLDWFDVLDKNIPGVLLWGACVFFKSLYVGQSVIFMRVNFI